jgi:hypothetical protein
LLEAATIFLPAACHAELSKDSLTITDVAISAANLECAHGMTASRRSSSPART